MNATVSAVLTPIFVSSYSGDSSSRDHEASPTAAILAAATAAAAAAVRRPSTTPTTPTTFDRVETTTMASGGIVAATSATAATQPIGDSLQYLCAECKLAAIIVYTCLSIVAFVGNSLVVAVIVHFRRLHTPTNMLILNLAIADLMISLLCMPLSYWHVIIFEDQRWVFGAFLCKTFNFLQATSVFLSSWTLVVVRFDRSEVCKPEIGVFSVDRFLAIMFIMSPWLRLNTRRAAILIIGTWLFSVAMALPLLIVNQTDQTEFGVDVCLEKWERLSLLGSSEKIMHSYTTLVFALQYCLPLLVLIFTYTCIGLRMWYSKPPEERITSVTATAAGSMATPKTRSTVQGRHDSVKKMVIMVLCVSSLYAACWLPQNLLMNFWVSYDPSITSHPRILFYWWFAHTIAMFHSTVNPAIYFWQNRRLREGMIYMLRCFPCIRFDGFHYLDDKKAGSRAVKIANHVAYAMLNQQALKVSRNSTS